MKCNAHITFIRTLRFVKIKVGGIRLVAVVSALIYAAVFLESVEGKISLPRDTPPV